MTLDNHTITVPTQLDGRARQCARETAAATEATALFWKNLDKHPQHSPLVKSLIQSCWTLLDEHIRRKQELFLSETRNLNRSRCFFLVIDSESLTVIALRCLAQKFAREAIDLWSLGSESTSGASEIAEQPLQNGNLANTEPSEDIGGGAETKYTALARELGRQCAEHWGFMSLAAKKRGIARSLIKYKTSSTRTRARKKRARELRTDWGMNEDDLGLGKLLLEATEDANLTDVTMANCNVIPWYTPNLVSPSLNFRHALKQWSDGHGDLMDKPFYLPMVVPPNSWSSALNDGGYLSNKEAKVIHLVKHRNSRNILKALKGADLTIVLSAINALQQTPWRVHRRIHGVMCQVRELTKSGQIKKADWNRRIIRRLSVCSNFVDESVIYFPYTVDFRGRVYCLPPEINPQADDIGRSLLEFATPKKLGESGASWLRIHVANSFGKDKISYSDRESWVRDNDEMILACANDPVGVRTWTECSHPWRFLRACMEWQEYRSQGPDYQSRLPVLMDGTCNGLQHLSALRLSESGAKETNLLPNSHPQDIYRKIADDLTILLKSDEQANGNELASEWLKNVKMDRGICKKAVMTTPYGVTREGIQLQLRKETFTESLEMHGCTPFRDKEIKYAAAFIKKLSAQRDETSKYIWERFAPSTRDQLVCPHVAIKEKVGRLVQELNIIRDGFSLRGEESLIRIRKSEETITLHDQAQSPKDLARLNRLILEDAFSRHLVKKSRRWECCEYLSKMLVRCIGEVVDPGNEMKKWFQEIAKTLAEWNIGISWTAPTGFPVVQEEWLCKNRPVKSGKYKTSIRKPILVNNMPVLDVDAQVNAVVANFIHSLDAAHLMLTVRRLHMEDLGDPIHFGVIHDGYAVHACDTDKLHCVLREEFVKIYRTSIYSESLLDNFRSAQEQAAVRRGTELRNPPKRGKFDIERVHDSPYFFC
jgi:hypothetical protein